MRVRVTRGEAPAEVVALMKRAKRELLPAGASEDLTAQGDSDGAILTDAMRRTSLEFTGHEAIVHEVLPCGTLGRRLYGSH